MTIVPESLLSKIIVDAARAEVIGDSSAGFLESIDLCYWAVDDDGNLGDKESSTLGLAVASELITGRVVMLPDPPGRTGDAPV